MGHLTVPLIQVSETISESTTEQRKRGALFRVMEELDIMVCLCYRPARAAPLRSFYTLTDLFHILNKGMRVGNDYILF